MFESVDQAYAIFAGRWLFCFSPVTMVKPLGAPNDTIGLEFERPTTAGGTAKMYYLEFGTRTMPMRGNGARYEALYDISRSDTGFQFNLHPDPTRSYPGDTIQYSLCPEKLEISVAKMGGVLVRIP